MAGSSSNVTPYFWTVSSTCTGLNLRLTIIVPPLYNTGAESTIRPPEWNMGRAIIMTSLVVRSKNISELRTLKNVFLCERVAPFGTPVVPEVYIMICGCLFARLLQLRLVIRSTRNGGFIV